MDEARARWNSLAKPLGSLGLLETALEDIAALTCSAEVAVTPRSVLMLCADNGVVRQGCLQPLHPDKVRRELGQIPLHRPGQQSRIQPRILGGSIRQQAQTARLLCNPAGARYWTLRRTGTRKSSDTWQEIMLQGRTSCCCVRRSRQRPLPTTGTTATPVFWRRYWPAAAAPAEMCAAGPGGRYTPPGSLCGKTDAV